jgi:serine/threonine protein kinase
VQLSDDCKDLITRIFVPDPNQRITLQEIKQHPWFLMKLPKELQVSRDAYWLAALASVRCAHVVPCIQIVDF